MLKVAHVREEEAEPIKKDGMAKYSDPAYFAQALREVVRGHNNKIRKHKKKTA